MLNQWIGGWRDRWTGTLISRVVNINLLKYSSGVYFHWTWVYVYVDFSKACLLDPSSGFCTIFKWRVLFKNEVISIGAFNNEETNTAFLCSWHFQHLSQKTKEALFRLITFCVPNYNWIAWLFQLVHGSVYYFFKKNQWMVCYHLTYYKVGWLEIRFIFLLWNWYL